MWKERSEEKAMIMVVAAECKFCCFFVSAETSRYVSWFSAENHSQLLLSFTEIRALLPLSSRVNMKKITCYYERKVELE